MFILECGDSGNVNVRAAFIHVIGDLLQSIGVLTAAFIIYFKVRVFCRSVGALLLRHAIGAGDQRFDSQVGQVYRTQCRQRLDVFRSCVVHVLSRGDEPRHSLHASA